MTVPPNDPNSRRGLYIAVAVGALVLLGLGIGLGVFFARGNDTAAPTPPATTMPEVTTSSIPSPSTTVQVTTTSQPPTSTTSVPQQEVSVPVAEDTTVGSEDEDKILGLDETLEVISDGDDVRRSLLRFNIDVVPEGQTIVDAKLRFLLTDSSHGGGTLNRVDGEWTEGAVTWFDAPPMGPPIAPLPIGFEGREAQIDLTGWVVGNGTVDLYMVTDSDDDYEIASKESGIGPSLVLTIAAPTDGGITRGNVLVGAGDIASCESQGDEATALIVDEVVASADEAVVFTTGDNAYEDGTAANFAHCYDPTWGRHKSITRPAAGAREYRSPDAGPYFDYFGEAAGERGKGYYSYDLGGWHVVVLNSRCDVVGCAPDSEQGLWLQEDLEQSNAFCTVAYWHDPPYSSTLEGGEPEMVELYDVMFQRGVDVAINGDDHFYERFAPQNAFGEEMDEGVRQFTVGSGGRSLADFGLPVSNSEVRYNLSFGVLVLDLEARSYEWEYITEEGVLFTDRGQGDCH
jgi:hypothetical protein